MIQQLAEYEGRIAKIEGPARSGKTEVLVRRCLNLIEKGIEADSILVVVSSEFAKKRFYERLSQAAKASLQDKVHRVVVSCARDVCTAILDTPDARAATGRVPHILTKAEAKFLLEDLKTLGQNNRRMQNMVAFFFAQWSKFEDENDWLIPGEETDVMGHIRRMLSLYGAMLRDEVAYVCGKFLLSEEGRAHNKRYSYVFCDDYQNLSRAEQTCMCLCAEKQLIVCGNPNETTQVNTDYPSEEGFVKFDSLRKNVEVFTLTTSFGGRQILEFGEALCGLEGMDERLVSAFVDDTGAEVLNIKWSTPEEEIGSTARYIESLLKRDPLLSASQIAVVVPNKRWGKLVEKALKQRLIPSSTAACISGIGGDPRVQGQHEALTAYIKLKLIAHPQNMIAWRAWCGFDNAITNSDVWDSMQKYAVEHGLSLYETLELTATTDLLPHARTAPIEQGWKSGQELIEKYSAYKGYSLLKAIGARGLVEFSKIEHALLGDEDAKTLYELVQNDCMNPQHPHDASLVHISDYENLCGLDYDYMFALGVVDGMVPDRDAFEIVSDDEKRQQILIRDRKRFYSGITKATRLLALSAFSKAGIEIAERTKMQVVRITSEQGERIARLQRSVFFQESGAACPSTVGGEDLMSELLLN